MSDRPRVRSDLRYSRQVQGGQTVIVVKDPLSMKYFRFGEMEVWLMERMDGSRTAAQIARELEEEMGLSASTDSIDAFVRRLKELGLADRSHAERRILLEESLRKERRLRLKGHGSTITRMRFSFGDPDRLFGYLATTLRFLFTPGFVAVSLAILLGYLVLLIHQKESVLAGLGALYDPGHYSVGLVASFYLLTIGVTVVHEFGHRLTCKHFGGEVHEAGAMLFYFSPAFFCNVNDAWAFENRAHRLWVTFAGGWIELVLAALASFVWILSEPGILLHDLAFLVMLVGGGATLLLNFNPLIPMDGYYALMDYLEIPNLRPRAMEYVGTKFKRGVLRLDVPTPVVTERERRIFGIYGTLAVTYLVLLTAAAALLGSKLLVGWFGIWGWIFLAAVAWAFALRPARQGLKIARAWAADVLPSSRRRRALAGGLAGVALASLLLFFTPWTVRVAGPAVLEPVARQWIRPVEAGRVEAVLVREGTWVAPGDTLAILSNPDLEVEWARAQAAVRSLTASAASARASQDTDREQLALLELEGWSERIRILQGRRSSLTLVSPFTGQVVSTHPDTVVGAWMEPGEGLLEVWSSEGNLVRVDLLQRDAGGIETGDPVGIRFPSRPDLTWRTAVARVGASAQDGTVEVWATLDSPMASRSLIPGMVGRGKVSAYRTTLAGALVRSVRRQLRLDFLL